MEVSLHVSERSVLVEVWLHGPDVLPRPAQWRGLDANNILDPASALMAAMSEQLSQHVSQVLGGRQFRLRAELECFPHASQAHVSAGSLLAL